MFRVKLSTPKKNHDREECEPGETVCVNFTMFYVVRNTIDRRGLKSCHKDVSVVRTTSFFLDFFSPLVSPFFMLL